MSTSAYLLQSARDLISARCGPVPSNLCDERLELGLRRALEMLKTQTVEQTLAELEHTPVDAPAWRALAETVTIAETTFQRLPEWSAEISKAYLDPDSSTGQRELARSNETLNSLYDLAGGLNHCRSEVEVATFAVEGALKIPGVRAAWLFLREANAYWLAGQAGTIKIDPADEHVEMCACQRLLESGGLTAAANIQQCDQLPPSAQASICGHVSIPLIIDGAGVGLLNMVSDRADGTFSADQRRMLASIGNQISDALQRSRLQEVLERRVEERTRQLQAEIVVRRHAESDAGAARERLLDAIDCINDGFALYDVKDSLSVHNRRYRDMHSSIGHLMMSGVKFEALVRAGLDSVDGADTPPSESHVQSRLAAHNEASGKPVIQRRGQTWLMASERRTREGGIVVVETDISELKKADIAKDEFLAKVSHELRTPLTPIHGALTIIGSGKLGQLPKNVEDLTDLARRNCARLMSIVNELLDFTRISSGSFSLDCRVIGIGPFLEQVIENKRIGPNPPNIELKISPQTTDLAIEADPIRIQQVLDNLLSNAIKFTNPGDHVVVTLERHNSALRINVIDHGPGIPKDFQGHLFQAFSQEDSSSTRRQAGVGLGLSISKSIVEAHGGTIGFTSKQGKGSTFFFELPLAPADQSVESGKRPRKAGAARRAKAAQCRQAP